MSWLKERGKSLLDNAAYDWLCDLMVLARPFLLPAIYATWTWFHGTRWNWRINAGLMVIAIILFCYTAYKLLNRPPQTATATQELPSYREPQAASVALDELKEMLKEGEKIVTRFSYGEYPTSDEVEEYRDKTLAAAKWRVFEPDRVTLEDIERFEENWDEDEVILKKAALSDVGRLADFFINPHDFFVFDRLYGRVERLRELIGVITGKVPHAKYEASAESPKEPLRSPSIFPAQIVSDARKAVQDREPGPRVLPPKGSHLEWEREQRASGISIHLDRSPAGILKSIEAEMDRINDFLDTYTDLLESYAPEAPPSTHAPPKLGEVDPDLKEHCLTILRSKGWMAFSALAQLLDELNQNILEHNDSVTAKSEHKVRRWSEAKIPKLIYRAKIQSATPL